MPGRAVALGLIAALAATVPAASPNLRAAQEAPATHPISVQDAWARPTGRSGGTAAVYLTIVNETDRPDQLLKAETPIAGSAGLHAVTMDGDMVRMREAPVVPIPANGKVVFRPGAWHVMLMDLKQPLPSHSDFPLALTFKNGGRVEVTVAVRKDAPRSFWGTQGARPDSSTLWSNEHNKPDEKKGNKKKGLGGLL